MVNENIQPQNAVNPQGTYIDPETGQPKQASMDQQLNAVGTAVTPPLSTPTTGTVATQQAGATASTSGLAVAGMVLGILAFLTSFIPILNIGSIIMGVLGLVLAIAGMVSISKGTSKGKGLAIAGIALSVLALLVTLIMYGSFAAVVDDDSPSSDTESARVSQEDNGQAATAASDEQNATGNEQDAGSEETTQENEEAAAAAAADQEFVVSIDGVRLGTDYQGKEIAIVSYTWTNNSDETCNFATTLHATAFQNSVEVDNIVIADGVNQDGYLADVKPGGTVNFEWAYAINDHSDLTVEVAKLFSFDDTLVAERTLSLE